MLVVKQYLRREEEKKRHYFQQYQHLSILSFYLINLVSMDMQIFASSQSHNAESNSKCFISLPRNNEQSGMQKLDMKEIILQECTAEQKEAILSSPRHTKRRHQILGEKLEEINENKVVTRNIKKIMSKKLEKAL
jgi:hypothetical protein